MSRRDRVKLPCPNCGHVFDAELWGSINTQDKELKEAFLEAKLNLVTCPKQGCGFTGFVPFPVLYHDMERQFMVYTYDRRFSENPEDEINPALTQLTNKLGTEVITVEGFPAAIVALQELAKDKAIFKRARQANPKWPTGKINAEVFLYYYKEVGRQLNEYEKAVGMAREMNQPSEAIRKKQATRRKPFPSLYQPYTREEVKGLQPGLVKRGLEHAQRINDYFANAVRVWLYADDQAAHNAALAAAKVAAKEQRESMVKYLNGLSEDYADVDDVPSVNAEHVCNHLVPLAAEISKKDWGLVDIYRAKMDLWKQDTEYAEALDRADPGVFSRRWPSLFDRLEEGEQEGITDTSQDDSFSETEAGHDDDILDPQDLEEAEEPLENGPNGNTEVTCEQARSLIGALLEGENHPEAYAHLASCPRCRLLVDEPGADHVCRQDLVRAALDNELDGSSGRPEEPIPRKAGGAKLYCCNCGKPVERGWLFCRACGSAQPNQSGQTREPSIVSQQVKTSFTRCDYCNRWITFGAKVHLNSKFCSHICAQHFYAQIFSSAGKPEFCPMCLDQTVPESLGGAFSFNVVFGTRLMTVGNGNPCLVCHSIVMRRWYWFLIPVHAGPKYRVLFMSDYNQDLGGPPLGLSHRSFISRRLRT